MPDSSLQIVELASEEQEAGLRLALRDFDPAQRTVQLAELRKAENAEYPSRTRVWGTIREKKLTGSLLVQTQPGRTASLWPPRLVDGEPKESAVLLLRECLPALTETDTRLLQALVLTDAGEDATTLQAAGFRHFSDLLYLVCPASEFPAAPLSCEVGFALADCSGQRQFADLVNATYEGTLDCPAASGLRSMGDVLLGYRAIGRFNPQWWLMVRWQGHDVGCLIMADYPPHKTCELIYIGLVPAARRQGFGVQIVRHALWLAATGDRQRLVLAVDAANLPALKMYAAAGFQAWDRKSVFIRVMPEKEE